MDLGTPLPTVRISGGGRLRAWLGARFGGDAELGDRIWRRCLHLTGGLVLAYYLIPPGFFGVVPKAYVLLAALGGVLALELARHAIGFSLPTLRSHEGGQVASYVFYAVALVVAVLVFPEAIATAVILGTALVDPLIGELRRRTGPLRTRPLIPLLVYGAIALPALRGIGGWSVGPALLSAIAAALVAVGVEEARTRALDDDFTMTLAPGALLFLIVLLAPGFPSWGG